MDKMTDSRAVEVLDRLRARASEWGDDTANVAALDIAIARLREPAEAQADEVVCLECGQPTMHMGQVCYACLHPADDPAEAQALFIAENMQNLSEPGTLEAEMVVLETDETGKPTIWCDPEIADLVRALNVGGLRTVASCSGHGGPFGIVTLKDGRELLVLPDFDTTRKAERALAAALAAEAQAQGGGEVAMEAWHSAVDNAAELRANAPDERYAKRAASVESWIKANRPAPPSAPVGVDASLRNARDYISRNGFGHDAAERIDEIDAALAQQPAAVDDKENRDTWRALWLVLRQTGTVTVPLHDIISADWSRCQVEQTEDEMTGTVRLRATLLAAQPGGAE